VPRHVGIILDGNRGHARKRGVSDPCEIYKRAAEQRFLPLTAGDMQGLPERVFAPHRRLERIGQVLRG
jgi:undecaprenyl pyrophosphate synthase